MSEVRRLLRSLDRQVAEETAADIATLGWTVEVGDPELSASWLVGFHYTPEAAARAAEQWAAELAVLDGGHPVTTTVRAILDHSISGDVRDTC